MSINALPADLQDVVNKLQHGIGNRQATLADFVSPDRMGWKVLLAQPGATKKMWAWFSLSWFSRAKRHYTGTQYLGNGKKFPEADTNYASTGSLSYATIEGPDLQIFLDFLGLVRGHSNVIGLWNIKTPTPASVGVGKPVAGQAWPLRDFVYSGNIVMGLWAWPDPLAGGALAQLDPWRAIGTNLPYSCYIPSSPAFPAGKGRITLYRGTDTGNGPNVDLSYVDYKTINFTSPVVPTGDISPCGPKPTAAPRAGYEWRCMGSKWTEYALPPSGGGTTAGGGTTTGGGAALPTRKELIKQLINAVLGGNKGLARQLLAQLGV